MKRIITGLLAALLLSGCASSRTQAPDTDRVFAATVEAADAAAPVAETTTPQDEKMIESWRVRMETEHFDEVFAELQNLIRQYDAFTDAAQVENRALHETVSQRHAQLRIRVEAQSTQAMLEAIRAAGHVVSESLHKENVTEQVTDLEGRRAMLEAKETRLNTLQSQAETIEDLLVIEGHLSETIAEKERILAQLQGLSRDVEYQFVEITLQEVSGYTSLTPVQAGFTTRLKQALSQTGTGFLRFLQNGIIASVYLLPYLLLLLAVAAIAWRVLRGRIRRRLPAAKTASKKEDGA